MHPTPDYRRWLEAQRRRERRLREPTDVEVERAIRSVPRHYAGGMLLGVDAAAAGGGGTTQSTHSIEFDGATGYAACSALPASVHALSFWIKMLADGSFNIAVSADNGSFWEFWAYPSADTPTALWNYATINPVTGSATLGTGAWHHVLMTCTSGGLLTLYIDGNSTGTPQTGTYAAPPMLGLGCRYPDLTLFTNCRIDDLMAYSTIPSPTQISDLAAGTLDPTTLSPAGVWRIGESGEAGGSALADSSGNGNNFSLHGGYTWSTDVPSQLA